MRIQILFNWLKKKVIELKIAWEKVKFVSKCIKKILRNRKYLGNSRNLGRMTKQIIGNFCGKMDFFPSQPWWSSNRDKISKVVRESEKVENRCSIRYELVNAVVFE